MNIRWIFFDAGYTLINEDDVWEHRFQEQAQHDEARRLGLTPEMLRQEVILNTLQRKPQYRTLIQKYGLSFSAPYRHELEKPYHDAVQVLETLASRYQLGVIANQTDGLKERLRHWGMLPYLSLIISSWDHQIMKPDPELFKIALTQAGCAGCEAIMIGDRLDNDIAPAKTLGMHTIWIRQGFGALQKPHSQQDQPDFCIEHLSALLPLLESM